MHKLNLNILSINSSIRIKKLVTKLSLVTLVSLSTLGLIPATSASAASNIGLGTASSFAVLAGAGITNSGSTTITGDIGTFPTPAITGYGSITQTGVNHADDAVTQGAKNDLQTAYNQAAAAASPTAVATELGGSTLTPGVYANGTLGITGTLTLDTRGDPNAVFVFQASSTLITASASNVVFLNGATSCNVYWQIGSSTTLGSNSHLEGTVLTQQTSTLNTGATVHGRILSLNGAVTLLTNTITMGVCGSTSTPTPTTTKPATTTAKTPVTVAGAPSKTPVTASPTGIALGIDSSDTAPKPLSSASSSKKTIKKTPGTDQGITGSDGHLAFTGFMATFLILALIILTLGAILTFTAKGNQYRDTVMRKFRVWSGRLHR